VWHEFFALVGLVTLLIGAFLHFAFGGAGHFLAELHLWIGGSCLALAFVGRILAGKKSTSIRSSFFSILSLARAALVVLFALIFLWSLRFDLEWDMTSEKMHSLYPETREFLEDLTHPIEISFIMDRNDPDFKRYRRLEQLFSQISNPKIRTKIVDPVRDIAKIENLGLRQGDHIHLRLSSGEDERTTRLPQSSELEILSAMASLAQLEKRELYYIKGQGEASLHSDDPEGFSELARLLSNRQFDLREITLRELLNLDSSSIPEVLWISPSGQIEAELLNSVSQRLDSGIRLLFLGSVEFAEQSVELFKPLELGISSGLVLDPVQQVMNQSPTLLFLQRFPSPHPIISPFSRQGGVILERASSLHFTGEKQNPSLYPLLVSPPQTIEQRIDGEQVAGPHTLAAVYEQSSNLEPGSRVVIFGSSSWASNRFFSLYNNRDLFERSLQWLLQGGEVFDRERPRNYVSVVDPLGEASWRKILTLGILLPELLLLFGLCVWWRRRRLIPGRESI